MKKAMYSLMLTKAVVSQIDVVSHQSGKSRSGFIDEILAQFLRIATTESILEEIYYNIGKVTKENMLKTNLSDGGTVFIASGTLPRPYSPKIKYSVALSSMTPLVGELRVVCRTSSSCLQKDLDTFFHLWHSTEEYHLGSLEDYHISNGKMLRILRINKKADYDSHDKLGQAIGEYILLLHNAMCVYLSEKYITGTKAVTELYNSYVKREGNTF